MRRTSAATQAAWLAEAKTGDRKAVVRATIQKSRLQRFAYDTTYAPGTEIDFNALKHRAGIMSSMLFGDDAYPREIRNIRNYTWTRSTDQDVGTCSMTLLNSELTPIGNNTRTEYRNDFDMPGFFAPNRGSDESQDRWGFQESGWEDVYMPDRVVKTYEGYGADYDFPPGLDENLYQSGTWLIDKVTMDNAGTITLEMRDLGRLLLDQIVFPPVIPYEEYPLSWSKIRSEQVPARQGMGGEWSGVLTDEGKATSSNTLYSDHTNDPGTGHPYVNEGGGVWGHYARDAITKQTPDNDATDPDDPEPYWLSTGQENRYDKVWWQMNFDSPQSLTSVRMSVMGGPYRVYISLQDRSGRWRGRKKIHYEKSTKNVNLAANKPFVATALADRGKIFDVVFPRAFHKIKAVRVTFTRLWDTQSSESYPWRAGLKTFEVYRNHANDPTGSNLSIGHGTKAKIVGNYLDYTDIVKWACGWGGFFWPGGGHENQGGQRGQNYIDLGLVGETDHKRIYRRYLKWATPDPRLARGRIWGDFMQTGTAGAVDLTVDQFDKQPLMDMISYVRDLTGFLFFIDEQGAAIFRMGNTWKKGNYLSPTGLGAHTRTRTQDFVTLDERQTLLQWQVVTSSESSREVIFVGNLVGGYASVIEGYAPSNAGLRRTAGWTDSRFNSKHETHVMAKLIATQQKFAYRGGQAKIPGNPAIQVDDQVKIWERVTNETYFHYVSGITAELDNTSGEFYYTLNTHWLGEDADSWVVKPEDLDGLTNSYLNGLDMTASDNGVKTDKDDDDQQLVDDNHDNYHDGGIAGQNGLYGPAAGQENGH